jgi:hypothetical protein
MSISSWFPWKLGRQYKGRARAAYGPAFRRGMRPAVEQLEDRNVPSNFTAATVSDLIADINAANSAGGSNTIALVAGNTYTLTAVDNSTDGATGLPVIAAKDNLTILGNGATIVRSTASGTPAFRLFDVAPGAALTLANVTVQGGQAQASPAGVSSCGGGIYSNGSLTLEAGTRICGNSAVGIMAGYSNAWGGLWSWPAGSGCGGGVYVAGGTAILTNVTLSSNSAWGGWSNESGYNRYWLGGDGKGGGLYVAGGTVTLTNDILSSNSAGGAGLMGMHLLRALSLLFQAMAMGGRCTWPAGR